MKRADASGAAYAIIIGDDEIAAGTVAIKALRAAGSDSQQTAVAFDAATEYLVDQIVGDAHDDDAHEHIHYHH